MEGTKWVTDSGRAVESRPQGWDVVLLDSLWLPLSITWRVFKSLKAQAIPRPIQYRFLGLAPDLSRCQAPQVIPVCSPGWGPLCRPLFIGLSSLLLSAWSHSTESSSHHRLRCLSSHNNLNRKSKSLTKLLSFSICMSMDLSCLGLSPARPSYSDHRCWGLGYQATPVTRNLDGQHTRNTWDETEQFPQRSKRTEQGKSIHLILLHRTSRTSSWLIQLIVSMFCFSHFP